MTVAKDSSVIIHFWGLNTFSRFILRRIENHVCLFSPIIIMHYFVSPYHTKSRLNTFKFEVCDKM